MNRKFELLLLITTMLHVGFLYSQNISWQQTNGPYGANTWVIAVNSDDHLFVGTDGGGVFRSIDGGGNWEQSGLMGLHVLAIIINSDGHLFASTIFDGVFRSIDNGENWIQQNKGLTNLTVSSLTIDSNGDIYAGTGEHNQNFEGDGIFRSSDGGENWLHISPNLRNTVITALVANSGGDVFAAPVGKGVFRLQESRDNWVQSGLENLNVVSMAVSASDDVFAGSPDSGEIYRSTDNGNTWQGMHFDGCAPLAITVDASNSIYAGSCGIFRSTDSGLSWVNIIGSNEFDIRAFATDSQQRIYAGSWGGVLRSSDNGETWEEVNEGISAVAIHAILFNSKGDVFASGSGHTAGVFKSSDLGETWVKSGLTHNIVPAMAINSLGHIYAGSSGGWFEGGVFRSTDDGLNWDEVNNGLTNPIVAALAINSRDDVFVGTGSKNISNVGSGIYRSIDNGDTWVQINEGLQELDILAIDVNINDEIFAGSNKGLYRSTNNGDSWQKLETGLNSIEVWSLDINDSNGNIYAATFGAGLIKSEDNGDTWQDANQDIVDGNLRIVTINESGELFTGTYQSVYHSPDDGDSWSTIHDGKTNRDIYSLGVSPTGFVFSGTYANGVYRTLESTNLVYPPSIPRLAFPMMDAQNQPINPVLYWVPYSNADSYHLQVSVHSDFTELIFDNPNITTTSIDVGPLENDKANYWRIRAKYNGETSPWSDIWKFTTIVELPDQVRLIYPQQEAILSLDVIEFAWSSSSPNVTGYSFELSTNEVMVDAQVEELTDKDTTKTVKDLSFDETYWWRVRAVNKAGFGPYSEVRSFMVSAPTGVHRVDEISNKYALKQNFPNPFIQGTKIKFSILHPGHTTLKVYNLFGNLVDILIADDLDSGVYETNWIPRSVPTGIYFLRLESSEFADIKRMFYKN